MLQFHRLKYSVQLANLLNKKEYLIIFGEKSTHINVSKEKFCPLLHFFLTFGRNSRHTFDHLFKSARLMQILHLRKEFVGKAYNLLLQCFGQHILCRKRPPRCNNPLLCQSRTRMAFTHACMARKSLLSQKFSTQIAMADIRSITHTTDVGRRGHENTYIMQHSRLFYKPQVETKFRVPAGHLQCKISHHATMFQQNLFTIIILRIIFIENY